MKPPLLFGLTGRSQLVYRSELLSRGFWGIGGRGGEGGIGRVWAGLGGREGATQPRPKIKAVSILKSPRALFRLLVPFEAFSGACVVLDVYRRVMGGP